MTKEDMSFDGYRPGAIAQMLTLHMDYYGRKWCFGRKFETYCAGGMAEFFENFDEETCFFLAARTAEGDMRGCIVIDGRKAQGSGAQLRWFIVDPKAHGAGIGRYLLEQAMTFCREKCFGNVFLTTFAGLDASRKLYESVGFQLAEEKQGDPWTGDKGELIFLWKNHC